MYRWGQHEFGRVGVEKKEMMMSTVEGFGGSVRGEGPPIKESFGEKRKAVCRAAWADEIF
jgi:hypothetical protein